MTSMSLRDAPLVLIIFNRPDLAEQLLAAVAPAEPPCIVVIADGPRPNRPDDLAKCAESRRVMDRIDWPCQVIKDYSEINMGVSRRIMSGLDHVFERFDRAIILEDDCLPHPSFFRFCDELLKRYRDDTRVWTICGTNFLNGKARTTDSYHFSIFHHNWGFATWRRSWQAMDQNMNHWPEIRDQGWLVDIMGGRRMAEFWTSRFNNTYRGLVNSWVYRYQLSCFLNNSLCIVPNRNLISNVGFREDATTTAFSANFAGAPIEAIEFPLKHPTFAVADRISDLETFRNRFQPEESPLYYRLARAVFCALSGRENVFSVRVNTGRLRVRD